MNRRARNVLGADKKQIGRIRELVRAGRYRSASHFIRAAIEEKLERDRRAALEREIERYVAAGHHLEDADLVAAQAWPR